MRSYARNVSIAAADTTLLEDCAGSDDIDRERTGKPAFLMVVTKNKVAYQMENGVYVVPLCCLKD